MEKIGNHIAFIPLRAGSKSIPGKNFKLIAGKPLFCHAVDACLSSGVFDKVVIATNANEVISICETVYKDKPKVILYKRSEENAMDYSSTESVMLEYSAQFDFNHITLVQATSPLTKPDDLVKAWESFQADGLQSLVTVVEEKRFYWEKVEGQSVAKPLNYDPSNRPRRQDFSGNLVENGAFYITSRQALEDSRCRLSGKMGVHIMAPETAVEIDEPEDFMIVENLLYRQGRSAEWSAKDIKLVLTDVDGVLTDAGMYYTEKGDELKKFNTLDGKGFELLRKRGYKVGIITGEDTLLVERRANKLKVDYLFQGAQDKLSIITDLVADMGISLSNVAFIGDDINDVELLSAVGLSFCPASAQDENKSVVIHVCSKNGGEGCFREMAELILANDGR